MSDRFELIVEKGTSRVRLEDYLLERFPMVSKMYLREVVRSELCEVNGRTENIGFRLRSDDFVEICLEADRGTAMRPESIDLNVVYEDADMLLIDKPAGMLMHPSHREHGGTLLNALVAHLNPSGGVAVVRPGLPHRLDRATSGLVLVAKTLAAHRQLSAQFMKKRVEKRYIALVEGSVRDDEGTIEAPIGRFPELKHWSVKADGKQSITRYWVRERRGDHTLLELEPVTGRTNQLRIHCQALGHPIIGDESRGGRRFERLCLHAFRLGFDHLSSRQRMVFEAPRDLDPDKALSKSRSV